MARTKQTARYSTGGNVARKNLATKGARALNKSGGCGRKIEVPHNYYNVQGRRQRADFASDESTLSGGGGCLANALRTYYVRTPMI